MDYFTEAEKTELMESVSSGAVGEFQKIVDSATTEYDDNHNSKLAEYNANASEKLTAYDTNAEQHTTDYNRNAEVKLEAYNSNHTEKVAEYNQNAETKTAEFDSNAAALQTEVDRLRGECDTLAAENRKQENRIDALMKLNKGQTYDIIPEEGETASRTAPSGSKYVGIDKVGGKSVAWNQLVNPLCFRATSTESGVTFTNNGNGSITVSGTATSNGYIRLSAFFDSNAISVISGHKHYCKLPNVIKRVTLSNDNNSTSFYNENQILSMNTNGAVSYDLYFSNGVTYNYTFKPQIFDLTAMFGAGNEPSTVEEFEAMFPKEYYEYCEPTIISSQTDRVDVASSDGTVTQQITTSFPVLNSAGSVYDYIDLNEGKLHQRVGVVDLGSFDWLLDGSAYTFGKRPWLPAKNNFGAIIADYVFVKNDTDTTKMDKIFKTIKYTKSGGAIYIKDSSYTDATTFKAAMSGVMLYYELAEEIITDIEIPTELTDWLPVEAGGTVTFRNADDSKQLAVPNAVSWVRKLDEVN